MYQMEYVMRTQRQLAQQSNVRGLRWCNAAGKNACKHPLHRVLNASMSIRIGHHVLRECVQRLCVMRFFEALIHYSVWALCCNAEYFQ